MAQPKVLVVDDNPITRRLVQVTLEAEGYVVVQAADGRSGLAAMAEHTPDVVLLDLLLPDTDGAELAKLLHAQPGAAAVPILAFSGFQSRLEQARQSAADFADFLFKPVEPSRLVATINTYLPQAGPARKRPAEPEAVRRVLVAEDDPVQRKLLAVRLEQAGYQVIAAEDGAEALELARSSPPDAVVSDILMPRLDGFALCSAVRQDPRLAAVPVVLVTAAYTDAEDRELAEQMGASAFVLRSPDCQDVLDALRSSIGRRPSGAARPGRTLSTEAYQHRVMRQLERQASQNIRLRQRVAWLETEMAILGALSQTLTSMENIEAMLAEMLYRCLDASGVSKGLAFLVGPDSRITLVSSVGYPGATCESCADLFGHADLLRLALESGEPVIVPSPHVPADVAQHLLEGADARAILLTPLILAGERLGLVMMASEQRELADEWGAFAKAIGSQVSQAVGLAQALASLKASEERFRLLAENSQDIVYRYRVVPPHGFEYVSPAAAVLTGYTPEELSADPNFAFKLVHPDDRPMFEAYRQDADRFNVPLVLRLTRKDGTWLWAEVRGVLVRDEGGNPTYVEGTMQDITERKQAEEQVKSQLRRVTALRTIDLAITGSLDLRVTVNVILDQVTSQLTVDAAALLLFNPHTQTLEYSTGRGFRSSAIARSRVRLGEGNAGRAALARRMVQVPNLQDSGSGFSRALLLAGENFVAYFAAPLIAKGQVKGVLECFHRSPLDPNPQWLDFLEALAGQAAIAVDNAALFDELQRSHAELALAYDTTLEGWVKALDLRDNETEGHSVRVTDMAVRLARAMGVGETQLVHVRRGALLHDMGKMGVADAILHKPGPLTEEEWFVMRRHPVHAYEMLSPIPYLRPALDIPYCHHEKWDGSGYPRGLRGEQIPFEARLFSIVDVWDALRSDRAYRPAWPEERVRAYLQEQAGSHFDPGVVQAFLGMDLSAP